MDIFNKLKERMAELEADAKSFYEKGNKTAGTRLRQGMLDLKALAQDVRVDVSQKKNS